MHHNLWSNVSKVNKCYSSVVNCCVIKCVCVGGEVLGSVLMCSEVWWITATKCFEML